MFIVIVCHRPDLSDAVRGEARGMALMVPSREGEECCVIYGGSELHKRSDRCRQHPNL
jgi:hypothetical protein